MRTNNRPGALVGHDLDTGLPAHLCTPVCDNCRQPAVVAFTYPRRRPSDIRRRGAMNGHRPGDQVCIRCEPEHWPSVPLALEGSRRPHDTNPRSRT